MSERAFELLELGSLQETESSFSSSSSYTDDDISSDNETDNEKPSFEPKLILDLGCGSGLSAKVIEEAGHFCIGTDISHAMLTLSDSEKLLHDMGDGVSFRPGVFDGVISISALQWLFHSHKKSHEPRRRLMALFNTLYASMCKGARAVFQFYPETEEQTRMTLDCARRAGFDGGLVIDYPNSTKAKKYFLCLLAGVQFRLPTAKGIRHEQEIAVAKVMSSHHNPFEKRKRKREETRREWVIRKKATARKVHGEEKIRPDSKYTARNRKPRF